uniref:Ig-like domain-containing protein n=1 Tax=Xiphophorus couchianus TaxID=32473 RepID=A0A3B5M009_9TELE
IIIIIIIIISCCLSNLHSSSFYCGNVTAEPGQDVVLPCRAAGNKRLIAVQWSRSDLGSDYVLRYRDERLDEENQNPSFRTRVALLDGAVKDGDVSLVLKNLTASDTGAYECGVAQREAGEANANMKLISTIYLQVAPPPPPGEVDSQSRKQKHWIQKPAPGTDSFSSFSRCSDCCCFGSGSDLQGTKQLKSTWTDSSSESGFGCSNNLNRKVLYSATIVAGGKLYSLNDTNLTY